MRIRELFMRVLFGMILGILLTVGVAYFHDTQGTGTATSGSGTVAQRNMVNWDVVDANWQLVRQRARETWSALSQKISS
jgi:hypothetical protein